jgi:hypothetical protein
MNLVISNVTHPRSKLKSLEPGEFFIFEDNVYVVSLQDKQGLTHCLKVSEEQMPKTNEWCRSKGTFKYCSFSYDHQVEVIAQDSITLSIDL